MEARRKEIEIRFRSVTHEDLFRSMLKFRSSRENNECNEIESEEKVRHQQAVEVDDESDEVDAGGKKKKKSNPMLEGIKAKKAAKQKAH